MINIRIKFFTVTLKNTTLRRELFEARRLARVLATRSPILLNSVRVQSTHLEAPHLWRSYHASLSSDIVGGNHRQLERNYRGNGLQCSSLGTVMQRKLFSTDASVSESAPTDEVKERHDRIIKSIAEQRTAPPNAWLWSLIAKCATHEDIKLLFEVLQTLRVFRLSNLRIHDNFNSALCQEVIKACVRVGAIDFGKKSLRKHNLYGLTPNTGSAHQLLLHAKQHKDTKLMAEVMELLHKNDLPLQPGTADLVFSICNETDCWGLLSKYSKRFIRTGVNLRKTSFDMSMELAANRGDVDSLWKAETLRSESKKQHTPVSGFACAKGFLLEHKPEDAAGVIQILAQALPDEKRKDITSQLEKLVGEWPLEVIKHQKEENRKALAAALQKDIPVMIASLTTVGLEVNVNLERFVHKSRCFVLKFVGHTVSLISLARIGCSL